MEKPFICENCHKNVSVGDYIGTAHRNHCPFCLWSKHVDEKVSGDRRSLCKSLMEPVGLIFKQEGIDKFTNQPRQGEIMVVHQCVKCNKVSFNRIAADDDEQQILNLLANKNSYLKDFKITLLTVEDIDEVRNQLFGK